eukprot:TRINITY_DN14000_c0_g1_i1.p1 TRINITY_DN14000_c0_g1~~TRINITY_DN14000_c0_g1_i1.p1  ORF type:complete len:974 (-),score=173.17 TRINITY_DN14000_c0_g1_i1:16-2937(-)
MCIRDSFLSTTNNNHALVGLGIMQKLIETLQEYGNENVEHSKIHRNIQDFRDQYLPLFVDRAFETVSRFVGSDVNIEIVQAALTLLEKCLTYNFHGNISEGDEFLEEDSMINIPTIRPSLQPRFQSPEERCKGWFWFANDCVPNIFFELYAYAIKVGAIDSVAALCLRICACLFRIKMNFFRSEDNYIHHIITLVQGLTHILTTEDLRLHEHLLIEFTNVIPRSNRVFHNDILLKNRDYQAWIDMVYTFTLHCLEDEDTNLTIINNLLHFWANFVSYLISFPNHLFSPILREKILSLLLSFVERKLARCSEYRLQENPLSDESQIHTHLKHIATLSRCNFSSFFQELSSKFEALVKSLYISQEKPSSSYYQILWIIHITTQLLKEKNLPKDILNDNMKLEQLNDQIGSFLAAIFTFWEEYDNAAEEISDSMRHMMELCRMLFFQRLSGLLFGSGKSNRTDKPFPVENILKKISNYLRVESTDDLVAQLIRHMLRMLETRDTKNINNAIALIKHITKSITWDNADESKPLKLGRVSISSKALECLYKPHFDNNFEVLSKFPKERTRLYELLTKILFMHATVNNAGGSEALSEIWRFLCTFKEIGKTFVEIEGSHSQQMRDTFLDLTSDLIGCILAAMNGKTWTLVIEFLFDIDWFETAARIISESNDSKAVNSCVKLCYLLLDNSGSRIPLGKFEQNREKVTIFRKLSLVVRALQGWLTRPVEQGMHERDLYQRRYKPGAGVLKLLSNMLNIRLVNLLLLSDCRDSDTQVLLDLVFYVIADTPIEVITSYIKKMRSFYSAIDLLVKGYFSLVLQVEAPLFVKILEIAGEGIESLDVSINIDSFNIITNIAKNYLVQPKKPNKTDVGNLERLRECQSVGTTFERILKRAFVLILNREARNFTWFAPMIFGLILLLGRMSLIPIAQELARQFGEEKEAATLAEFDRLFKGVRDTFDKSNIDAFQANLSAFSNTLTS